MRKRRQKGLRVSDFALSLVVFNPFTDIMAVKGLKKEAKKKQTNKPKKLKKSFYCLRFTPESKTLDVVISGPKPIR